jgi:N-acetylneuraminic acid mutarotase
MGMFVFGGVLNDFFSYDPISDSWNQIASISPSSDQSSAFTINDIGYVSNVGGNSHQIFSYNANSDSWVFEASFPETRIANATTSGIGGKGYLVFGQSTGSGGNVSSNKLWEFVPSGVSIKGEQKLNSNVFADAEGILNVIADTKESLTVKVFSIEGNLLYEGQLEEGSGRINMSIYNGLILVVLSDSDGRKSIKKVML